MKAFRLIAGLLMVLLVVGVAVAGGDVPITTKSDEAREAYLEGRDLLEGLRVQDAREYFKQAVKLDPYFALAHLGMANSSTNAPEFWAAMGRAMKYSGQVSEGERLMILANEAGAKREPAKQRELLEALVKAHPKDPRALGLLGTREFGDQNYTAAVVRYETATEIEPNLAPTYNMLGYSHRALENHDEAEAAFKKYVELIPDEPNPYDSYAEFLMKRGRYEEAIVQYKKALDLDEHFVASYIGIANNQMFMGKTEAARATLQGLYENARNDGERRQACYWTATSYVHDGKHELAIAELQKSHDLAAKADDYPGMSADLGLMGNVWLEAENGENALDAFQRSHEVMQKADVPEPLKAANTRTLTYNKGRVALLAGDLDGAKSLSEEFAVGVAERHDPIEMWQAHELAGMIAFHEGAYDDAVAQLKQANQQNPRVLYQLGLACAKAGDHDGAKMACEKAADFNGLNFNYAFVKREATEAVEAM